MVKDNISNIITKIKNANFSKREKVSIPLTSYNHAIVSILEKSGYVSNISKKEKKSGKEIEIGLVYVGDKPKIKGIARLSRNSKRMYLSLKEITPVKNGHGHLILSTPKGVLTDSEAKKHKVGGEPLFKIW